MEGTKFHVADRGIIIIYLIFIILMIVILIIIIFVDIFPWLLSSKTYRFDLPLSC